MDDYTREYNRQSLIALCMPLVIALVVIAVAAIGLFIYAGAVGVVIP